MFTGWTDEDFAVFEVEGLEPRMDALKARVRPKFEAIGKELAPDLSAHFGEEFFIHVAKHARRTTNPPIDSWVSFATNPRGYKMMPHFEVGLWSTHAFIEFAVIYECVNKKQFGEKLVRHWSEIKRKVPSHIVWFEDHTKPKPIAHTEMDDKIEEFTRKLIHNKNGEILAGIEIPRAEATAMSGQAFLDKARQTIYELEPLYRLFK